MMVARSEIIGFEEAPDGRTEIHDVSARCLANLARLDLGGLIVVGGDGTMLNIARVLAPFDVALVGVNQGRLGFLTDISIDTMHETIGAILDGQ